MLNRVHLHQLLSLGMTLWIVKRRFLGVFAREIRNVHASIWRAWALTNISLHHSLRYAGHLFGRFDMPINTSEFETRALIALFRKSETVRSANAFSRVFKVGQPFRVGDKVVLCATFGGHPIVFAGAVIRAVLESTFEQRIAKTAQATQWALAEGYESTAKWAEGMKKRYPGIEPKSRVLRVLLNEIRLSPEMTEGVGGGAEFDPYTVPAGKGAEPKTVMTVQNLDAFGELGG